jgi:hypothetical protein
MQPDIQGALRFYEAASEFVRAGRFAQEVDWQRRVELSDLQESDLLRETAWVVLCSGFREATVRRLFDYVSLCYCDWESAEAIVTAGERCITTAKAAFRNEAKLIALLTMAEMVAVRGFENLKDQIVSNPLSALRSFPFIGPVTVYHLAKNLGFDVAKHDRHLVRASKQFGFHNPDGLCKAIAEVHQERVKVVDLVIWRFLASGPAARQAAS